MESECWLISLLPQVATESQITYMTVKTALRAKYGDDLFNKHKTIISQMCIEATMQSEQDPTGGNRRSTLHAAGLQSVANKDELISRLRELLASSDSSVLTYTRLKSKLVKEFGPTSFRHHRTVISTELVLEMSRRMTQKEKQEKAVGGKDSPRRVLAVSVIAKVLFKCIREFVSHKNHDFFFSLQYFPSRCLSFDIHVSASERVCWSDSSFDNVYFKCQSFLHIALHFKNKLISYNIISFDSDDSVICLCLHARWN